MPCQKTSPSCVRDIIQEISSSIPSNDSQIKVFYYPNEKEPVAVEQIFAEQLVFDLTSCGTPAAAINILTATTADFEKFRGLAVVLCNRPLKDKMDMETVEGNFRSLTIMITVDKMPVAPGVIEGLDSTVIPACLASKMKIILHNEISKIADFSAWSRPYAYPELIVSLSKSAAKDNPKQDRYNALRALWMKAFYETSKWCNGTFFATHLIQHCQSREQDQKNPSVFTTEELAAEIPSSSPPAQRMLLMPAMSRVSSDTNIPGIANFFSLWFAPGATWGTRWQLYDLLLQPIFRDDVQSIVTQLTDLKRDRHADRALPLIPAELNAIFLHAILTPPPQWEPTFMTLFTSAQTLVEELNYEAHDRDASRAALQQTYAPLLPQLFYLWVEAKGAEALGRPNQMILIPEQIKTIEEWVACFALRASRAEQDRIIDTYHLSIKACILQELNITSDADKERYAPILYNKLRDTMYSLRELAHQHVRCTRNILRLFIDYPMTWKNALVLRAAATDPRNHAYTPRPDYIDLITNHLISLHSTGLPAAFPDLAPKMLEAPRFLALSSSLSCLHQMGVLTSASSLDFVDQTLDLLLNSQCNDIYTLVRALQLMYSTPIPTAFPTITSKLLRHLTLNTHGIAPLQFTEMLKKWFNNLVSLHNEGLFLAFPQHVSRVLDLFGNYTYYVDVSKEFADALLALHQQGVLGHPVSDEPGSIVLDLILNPSLSVPEGSLTALVTLSRAGIPITAKLCTQLSQEGNTGQYITRWISVFPQYASRVLDLLLNHSRKDALPRSLYILYSAMPDEHISKIAELLLSPELSATANVVAEALTAMYSAHDSIIKNNRAELCAQLKSTPERAKDIAESFIARHTANERRIAAENAALPARRQGFFLPPPETTTDHARTTHYGAYTSCE